MELEVRKRANLIETLDSNKSSKKNRNFSSTKFPTKLLGSIGNKKSPTKSRESSKFSNLPENKRSFSQPQSSKEVKLGVTNDQTTN